MNNSYVKCYIKTEVMECNGNTLRRGQNAQNHKYRHLDKDSIWTPICVGPPPLVGYKKSEL